MDQIEDNIRCVVVDDEHLARELLTDYISKIPNLELVAALESPLELMTTDLYKDVDIMFLDIQMPDITGIDFLKSLARQPIVIFTTAYSEYALEGYELNVVEYLLKPIAFPRFVKAVKKAVEIAIIRRKAMVYNTPAKKMEKIESPLDPDNKNYIIIKADRKINKVNYSDIIYIEGALEYVTFHLKNENITGFYSLKELEKTLPTNSFMRVHRSYIVNTKMVNALEGNILKIEGIKIPIGASYKKKVYKEIFE